MPEQTSVIILGASPSVLAAAACLRERAFISVSWSEPARSRSNWRNHYERLHLHTIKHFSALPGPGRAGKAKAKKPAASATKKMLTKQRASEALTTAAARRLHRARAHRPSTARRAEGWSPC